MLKVVLLRIAVDWVKRAVVAMGATSTVGLAVVVEMAVEVAVEMIVKVAAG